MNERLFELIERVKSEDPEEVLNEVTNILLEDEELVRSVVMEYSVEIAEQVMNIKTLLNDYQSLKELNTSQNSPKMVVEKPANPFKH